MGLLIIIIIIITTITITITIIIIIIIVIIIIKITSIRSSEFNCMNFGRYINWLRLATQSLFLISGHPEVFTAIIIIKIIIIIIIVIIIIVIIIIVQTYLYRIAASVLGRKLLSMQVLLIKIKGDHNTIIVTLKGSFTKP